MVEVSVPYELINALNLTIMLSWVNGKTVCSFQCLQPLSEWDQCHTLLLLSEIIKNCTLDILNFKTGIPSPGLNVS